MSKLMRDGIPRKDDGKVDWTPRKHHGWYIVIVICGFLLPPLAVAARFGFGKDFCINVILTLCGYIPGHGHNFFIQNIRDNNNKNRTPKWAKRYGLVDDAHDKKMARKRQWVGRYNDRNTGRVLYDENGNPTVYDQYHRYEEDDASSSKSGGKRRNGKPRLVDADKFYNEDPRPRSGDVENDFEGDAYSLRRSQSRSRGGGYVDDNLPGAGEAARRKAKGGKARALLGGKSSGKDRHARSDLAMGGAADDNHYSGAPRGPMGEFDDDLLGGSAPATRSHTDIYDADDGPEDVEASFGKSYAREQAALRKREEQQRSANASAAFGGPDPLSNQLGGGASDARNVDIMDQRHEF